MLTSLVTQSSHAREITIRFHLVLQVVVQHGTPDVGARLRPVAFRRRMTTPTLFNDLHLDVLRWTFLNPIHALATLLASKRTRLTRLRMLERRHTLTIHLLLT